MTLRLELFVEHLTSSLDSYGRVLGFAKVARGSDGDTPLERDAVRLALNLRAAVTSRG